MLTRTDTDTDTEQHNQVKMLSQQLIVSIFAISQSLTLALAFQASPSRTFSPRPILQTSNKHRSRLQMSFEVTDAVSTIDAFYRSSPYEAAFFTCGIKASAADFLAQTRELKASSSQEDKSDDQIEFERNLAFILYGGLYQGIAQYYIYNILFPLWFGQGNDLTSVMIKVAFDMSVISPFLCLPIAYLTKATIYGQSWKEGLTKYKYDLMEKNLLGKYCTIWVPAQFCTFGVIPEHLRIPFIAVISFFWLIILSTVSSAEVEDEVEESSV